MYRSILSSFYVREIGMTMSTSLFVAACFARSSAIILPTISQCPGIHTTSNSWLLCSTRSVIHVLYYASLVFSHDYLSLNNLILLLLTMLFAMSCAVPSAGVYINKSFSCCRPVIMPCRTPAHSCNVTLQAAGL